MGREFGRKCFLAAPLCLGWKSAGSVGAAISGGGEDLQRGLVARGLHGTGAPLPRGSTFETFQGPFGLDFSSKIHSCTKKKTSEQLSEESSLTVWFFLPGPEADSTSSRQQPFQLFLTLGREMKCCSVTCARVSKAASGLCGENGPEAWAVTSNPGLADMRFMQNLEVDVTQARKCWTEEEQGSLGTSSTASDCMAVCGRWECHSFKCSRTLSACHLS
ncbi:uncharacterized protein LOC143442705 isoform X3 [Arvicanthis niloticus]|uniref:uncharacterized protein LOC143312953 isoform X3 n=1 Tax=Arvicanthis niloticus TaxID=61156 RepID=UPI00402B77D1